MADTANPSKEMQRWAERSRRVAGARQILPLAILAIVLVMAGFIAYRTFAPGRLLMGKPGEPMVNPRFKGRDDEDRPFLIGAVQAIRDAADQKRVVLNEPFVTLGQARLSAKTGVYRPDQSTLTLQGRVVFDDGKNRLSTSQAVFDGKSGVISGQPIGPGDGVSIEGAMGKVRADSFKVYDSGNRIELAGGVRGEVTPASRR